MTTFMREAGHCWKVKSELGHIRMLGERAACGKCEDMFEKLRHNEDMLDSIKNIVKDGVFWEK